MFTTFFQSESTQNRIAQWIHVRRRTCDRPVSRSNPKHRIFSIIHFSLYHGTPTGVRELAWVVDFNIYWPWICSRRMHVFSKHVFSKLVFSKHVFSEHVCSKHVFSKHVFFWGMEIYKKRSYFWHIGYLYKSRKGVWFSHPCTRVVLRHEPEWMPWDSFLWEKIQPTDLCSCPAAQPLRFSFPTPDWEVF